VGVDTTERGDNARYGVVKRCAKGQIPFRQSDNLVDATNATKVTYASQIPQTNQGF